MIVNHHIKKKKREKFKVKTATKYKKNVTHFWIDLNRKNIK